MSSNKIVPIYKLHAKYVGMVNCNKYEHSMDNMILMSDKYCEHAVRLALDNLILTYGFEIVQSVLNNIAPEIKKAG